MVQLNGPLKLMCVLAHPDDESLGVGGILARYAAEGVETHLLTATRGERGWFGPEADYPGPEPLGRIREAELQAAARVLGLRSVNFLDYYDGELDQADPAAAIAKLVAHLRRVRPQVVVTFDPYGAYGHPDHIAICQLTTAAVAAAAHPGFDESSTGPPHQVAKLYYLAETKENLALYQRVFGDLVMPVDGVERRVVGWPDWAITTQIDTSAYRQQVWQAIACHHSQLPGYQAFKNLSDEEYQTLWRRQAFYRVLSLVNGGREVERDLFEGLR
jgi:LmbE family N-acetylglucosaminyl deacetylase